MMVFTFRNPIFPVLDFYHPLFARYSKRCYYKHGTYSFHGLSIFLIESKRICLYHFSISFQVFLLILFHTLWSMHLPPQLLLPSLLVKSKWVSWNSINQLLMTNIQHFDSLILYYVLILVIVIKMKYLRLNYILRSTYFLYFIFCFLFDLSRCHFMFDLP